MNRELDTLARLSLVYAIGDMYADQHPDVKPEVSHLIIQLEAECEKAFAQYSPFSDRSKARMLNKIMEIKRLTSLNNGLSIVTYIEFALAIIDEPARRCKGARQLYCKNIAEILLTLHKAISGGREYALSTKAAANAADVWESVEI